jgi:hypothetical protein
MFELVAVSEPPKVVNEFPIKPPPEKVAVV